MKKAMLAVLLLSILLCVACAAQPNPSGPATAPETAVTTDRVPPASPPSTLAHTIPPPTQTCDTHTASAQVLLSAQTVAIGEQLVVRVTLLNQGCVGLGLPMYTLRVHAPQGQPLFDPPQPEAVTHYLAVAPGQSDSVEFVLRGAQIGSGTLQANVSFEVHIGYPGPAYWGTATSALVDIAVVNALKLPDSDQPAAGICDPEDGAVVTITINADVPSPRCVKVASRQQLKYVNATGAPLRVAFWMFDVQIPPGQEYVFDMPVGEYLTPGVHRLGGAEVWLTDR